MTKTYCINMLINKLDISTTSIRHELNKEIVYSLCNNPLNKYKNIKSPYVKESEQIKDYNKVFFLLDFDEIVHSKKSLFKNIKKIKIHLNTDFIYVYVQNYKSSNEQDVLDILQSLKIHFIKSKYARVDYIYDKTCEYLDNEFTCKNICQFINNKCIAKRDYDLDCGCCRHSKNKSFFALLDSNYVTCEFLKNKQCTADCISCKLYTCPTLNKMGIKFKMKDLFLIHNYFNIWQKIIIKSYCFTPKEIILKKLL